MAYTTGVDFTNKLREALGIVRPVKGITLRCYCEEVVSASVEFFVTKDEMEAIVALVRDNDVKVTDASRSEEVLYPRPRRDLRTRLERTLPQALAEQIVSQERYGKLNALGAVGVMRLPNRCWVGFHDPTYAKWEGDGSLNRVETVTGNVVGSVAVAKVSPGIPVGIDAQERVFREADGAFVKNHLGEVMTLPNTNLQIPEEAYSAPFPNTKPSFGDWMQAVAESGKAFVAGKVPLSAYAGFTLPKEIGDQLMADRKAGVISWRTLADGSTEVRFKDGRVEARSNGGKVSSFAHAASTEAGKAVCGPVDPAGGYLVNHDEYDAALKALVERESDLTPEQRKAVEDLEKGAFW